MLKNKTVVLAVTGGIAAYKMAALASMLVKQHANVLVLMTKNATEFISPLTFESLTHHRCMVDTFDRNFEFDIAHVSVAHQADLVLVAPATANVIGKLANGIADDMLTTTVMACKCPKLIAPAMNTQMYENPIVQDNMDKLRRFGMEVIEAACGRLACGDTGAGKLPEPEVLLQHILRRLACAHDMQGKKVLVTAGPTREAIDPVRFITNRSTGRMGYALAEAAMLRGAEVTLVSGPVALAPPPFVRLVQVESAAEMCSAVLEAAPQQDIIIKAAAVADYRPAQVAGEKIKKGGDGMALELARTQDILKTLGESKRPGQFLCGFAMETQDLLENAKHKLARKNADLIVANSLREAGAGFGTSTNKVTLVWPDRCEELALADKSEVAHRILSAILAAQG